MKSDFSTFVPPLCIYVLTRVKSFLYTRRAACLSLLVILGFLCIQVKNGHESLSLSMQAYLKFQNLSYGYNYASLNAEQDRFGRVGAHEENNEWAMSVPKEFAKEALASSKKMPHNTEASSEESLVLNDFIPSMHKDNFGKVKFEKQKLPAEALHALENLPYKTSLHIEDVFGSINIAFGTRKQTSRTKKKSCWPKKINKLLHFVWLDPKGDSKSPLPRIFEKNLQRWAAFAPEHKMYLWRDTQINRLIRSIGLEKLFQKLTLMVFKADLVRYIIVYYFGGTPLDLDLTPVVPLNFWFGSHEYGFPCNQSKELELLAAPELCRQHVFQMSGYSVMKGSFIIRRTLQNMFIMLGKYVLNKPLSSSQVKRRVIGITGPYGFAAGIVSFFNLNSTDFIDRSLTSMDNITILEDKYGFLPYGDVFFGRILHQSVNLWHPTSKIENVKNNTGEFAFSLEYLKRKRKQYSSGIGPCDDTDMKGKRARHFYEQNYLYKNWEDFHT
eukprot:Nk52_evm23s684 gene=Nk52_evmTU23s684